MPGSTEQHQYLRLARADGAAMEVEAQIARHHDARGQLQTQVMLRDVTERREAEARVAASEKRLREIADNVTGLIGEHDLDTRYLQGWVQCRTDVTAWEHDRQKARKMTR